MAQLSANNRRRKDIYKIPRADQELLTALGYKSRLHEIDEAIIANAQFLKQLIADPEIFGHELEAEHEDAEEQEGGPSHSHGTITPIQVLVRVYNTSAPKITPIRTPTLTEMQDIPTRTAPPRLLRGANSARQKVTWTNCEAPSSSSCATGARRYSRHPPLLLSDPRARAPRRAG